MVKRWVREGLHVAIRIKWSEVHGALLRISGSSISSKPTAMIIGELSLSKQVLSPPLSPPSSSAPPSLPLLFHHFHFPSVTLSPTLINLVEGPFVPVVLWKPKIKPRKLMLKVDDIIPLWRVVISNLLHIGFSYLFFFSREILVFF